VNAAHLDAPVHRDDIEILTIPASRIAESMGDSGLTEMIMLGALLASVPVLPLRTMKHAVRHHLTDRTIDALEEGEAYFMTVNLPIP
jgi:2-oxoglutarate ferredoxin oxidoreductase subunit gamma